MKKEVLPENPMQDKADSAGEERATALERLAADYLERSGQELYWEEVRKALGSMPPTICFSRKIGVGALDLARLMAQKIGYRIIDREIVEFIAQKAQLNAARVEALDESSPGRLKSVLQLLLGEKPFQMTDYSGHLFAAVYFLAVAEPTIFVGRGTHLVLPREKVFAVRCISSLPYRAERLARKLGIDTAEAEKRLKKADREQRNFFREVYRRSSAPPSEFDVVLNFDHLHEQESMADTLIRLFTSKYGLKKILETV